MTKLDYAAVEAALHAERDQVCHQLRELGATESGELTGEVDFGDAFADAGAATAERTETIGIVETLTKRLADVDAALAKLAEGTFGICEACGQPIEPARLEFRPTSVRCVSCKEKAS